MVGKEARENGDQERGAEEREVWTARMSHSPGYHGRPLYSLFSRLLFKDPEKIIWDQAIRLHGSAHPSFQQIFAPQEFKSCELRRAIFSFAVESESSNRACCS